MTTSLILTSENWRSDVTKAPTAGGVYRIRNTVNGKCYVGSAQNIRRRWRTHMRALSGAMRGQKYLIHAWRKYGAESFVFEVLELVHHSVDLLQREQVWIDCLGSSERGYNIRKVAASNLGLRLPQSEESKRKIGAANRGRRFGPECHHWLRGRNHAESSRLKMRATKRSRESHLIEFDGVRLCLSDWADRLGITVRGLGNRLSRGWPLDRAFTEASRGY